MGSVFDEYSRSETERINKMKGKKPARASSPKALPPSPLANPADTVRIKEQYRKEGYEASAIFKRIDEMKSDLDSKIREVVDYGQRSGINPNTVMTLIESSYPKEIEFLKATSEALQKDTDTEQNQQPKSSKRKDEDSLTKERRGKTRGARQKWLPMS